MKTLIAATVFLGLSSDASVPLTKAIPSCRPEQLLAEVPTPADIAEHRQAPLPTIRYPFGSELAAHGGGFALTLRVDAGGRVECVALQDRYDEPEPIDAQRQQVLETLGDWQYSPFRRGDQAVAAIVREVLPEVEEPERIVATPEAPLAETRFTLSRSGCFGTCPSYTVEVSGDGRVVYTGAYFVDVVGTHRYTIAPEAVARLLDSVRRDDLWSTRESYRANITDNPTYTVTLTLGRHTHTIVDYVGTAVGMPTAVTAFEKQLDEVSRSADFIALSRFAVDTLDGEGYDFHSNDAGELLRRAVNNDDGHDDAAMALLIERGAPLEVQASDSMESHWFRGRSLFEATLLNRRERLVDALVARGALQSAGVLSPDKLDAAFRAAIRGGSVDLVRKIWTIAGGDIHPALVYRDDGDRGPQESPVTLLLEHPVDENRPWQGREIADWLASLGCDLGAHGGNGRTLLHIAAAANDVGFVRYLVDRGVDPMAIGEYDLPPISSTTSEEVAIALISASTGQPGAIKRLGTFRDYATQQHWLRAIQQLDALAAAAHREDP